MISNMSGLIIKDPYISRILNGQKTWEMRSTKTSKQGLIALIKKGSGHIYGVASLVDVKGPLSRETMLNSIEQHTIDKSRIESGEVDKWKYAWVLQDAKKLSNPVSYQHKSGAVIWVNLDSSVSNAVSEQL
jgi:hypothetical protein